MSPLSRAFFSTDHLPERDRFDAWRALLSAHDLDADPNGFSASLETTQLDSMLLHVMDASPQGTGRTRSRIRQDGQERFTLLLSRHAYRVEAEHGASDVPAGAISLNDLSRPYRRSRVPETGSIVLSLPRESVAGVLPDEDALHGLILTGTARHLLAEHLRGLVVNRHAIDAAQAPDLAQATLHLLAACARPTRDSLALARAPADAARLSAAKRFIRAHLARPIAVEEVAAALGLSRSRLYRLFEPEGGVARYLARQRLAAVRSALRDSRDGRSVGAIGEACGFANLTYLSRAFREAYGQSPRDYRASRDATAEPTTGGGLTAARWMGALG